MRNWTIAMAPLALAMMTTGCSGADEGRASGGAQRAGDGGPETTQSYELTGFTAVEVTGPDDVTIRQGEAFSISATGPQAEIDNLEIELDGSALSIGRKREGFGFGRDHDGVKIAVTMPSLAKLRLTGSGDIDADKVEGEAMEAIVTGSGDMKIASMTGQSAEMSVSGSGDIEVGGGVAATGDYSVTGSGNIDARGLKATDLDISVTGSGDIDAQATGKAEIGILGSGDVELTGGASCSTRAMGSGTASCK